MTVKEIARLAGVSIGTVDRVLHDRGGVSVETRARVEALVSSLGYKPNVIGRLLSLKRSPAFRAVLPRADQDSGYWALCLEGMEEALRELAPYQVSLRVDEFDRYDPSSHARVLAGAIADPGDGLLIAPVHPAEVAAALAGLEEGLPYVFFDGSAPGTRPWAEIGQDATAGGRLAARMLSLFAPGSSPLVTINPHPEIPHIGRRIEGFLAGLKELAPLRPALVRDFPGIEVAGACGDFMRGLFRELPDLGGILVANASGHRIGDWLLGEGRKGGCALLSWDLVPANARGLRSGAVDCVISQRPREQGREGLRRLFAAALSAGGPAAGEGAGQRISFPLELHLRENLPIEAGADEVPDREGR